MSFMNDFPHTHEYEQDLGWLLRNMQDLLDKYDDIYTIVQKLQTALATLPAQIRAEVEEQLADAMEDVNATLSTFDIRIENLENSLNTLDKEVDNLFRAVTDVYNFIEKYTDMIGEDVYNRLLEYLKTFVNDWPPVICPVDNNTEGINTALQHLYNFYNQGLTAQKYDNMELTAQEYDEKRITAGEYDAFGYRSFYERLYATMISPFTGQIDLIKNVVDRLADFHKLGITAAKYDALNLTAGTYDERNYTAYYYDWSGAAITA